MEDESERQAMVSKKNYMQVLAFEIYRNNLFLIQLPNDDSNINTFRKQKKFEK